VKVLGAQNIVWVPANVLKAAGVTEFELPLYRSDGGPRSSLMHVSNERAVTAGLTLTAPELTVKDTQDWLPCCKLAPALSPDLEGELISISQSSTLPRV
jgi:2'-hydroxyisoflavone reductase